MKQDKRTTICEVKQCCICGKNYCILGNVGNNAFPIKEGECCDECNWSIVVPKRIQLIKEGG